MIGSPTFPRQSTLPLKFRTNPAGPTAPTMVVPPPGQSAVTAVGTEKQATLRNAPAGTPLNGSHPKNTLTRPRPTLESATTPKGWPDPAERIKLVCQPPMILFAPSLIPPPIHLPLPMGRSQIPLVIKTCRRSNDELDLSRMKSNGITVPPYVLLLLPEPVRTPLQS